MTPSTARDPLLRALAVSTVVCALWFAPGLGPLGMRVVSYWLIQVALNVVFIVGCQRVARLMDRRPSVARFWRRMALTGILLTVGDGLQLFVALADPTYDSVQEASLPTLVVAAAVAVSVWAMLAHPIFARGRERLRWWLDAAIIMVGAAAAIWTFLWAWSDHDGLTRVASVLLASCLGLVSALGLVKLLLGGNAPFTPAAGIAGGITAAGTSLATVFAAAASEGRGLDLAMAVRLVPCFLLAATPRIQELKVLADPTAMYVRAPRPYSRLPYLALAGTQLLLVTVLVRYGLDARAWGVLVAVMVSTALVVVRQLVSFTDNARLLASLDETMLTIRQQEERFRSLVQQASDVTAVTGRGGVLTYASPAIEQVLGISPEQLSSISLTELFHPDDREVVRDAVRTMARAGTKTVTTYVRARHVDGDWRWLEIRSTNLLTDPSVVGIVHNVRDVTEARRAQQQLWYEAHHDTLTGLANRALLQQRLRSHPPGTRIGVLLLDLDDFKEVNDTLGHRAGDDLLAAVAGRLLRCVRAQDTVARLGGDEFAIVVPEAGSEDLSAVAERIMECLAEPVPVRGHLVVARASIGMAVGTQAEAETLLVAADSAMYQAKSQGKDTFVLLP